KPQAHAVLVACVDPDNVFEELNKNDNCAEWVVGPGQSDLSIHPRDISFAPAGAAVGEEVRLSAVVRNASNTAATAVVESRHANPNFPEAVLMRSLPISVPANGSATAVVDWVRQDGSVEVYARVSKVVPRDRNRQNNLTGRHLYLKEIVDLGLSEFGQVVDLN